MNQRNPLFTRRQFLKGTGATGISIAGGLTALSANTNTLRADEPTSTAYPAPYPSHGPSQTWLANSRNIITEKLLPPPTARRVNKHVFVSSRLENVFYVPIGRHAVLFDTGFHHQVDHHLDNFEKMGCDLSKIVAILASHSHVDHTAGLNRAKKRLGVPVVAHPNAVKPIGTGDLLQTAAIIPEADGWEFEFPKCVIDETVDQGDRIVVDGEHIDVYHVPGHTPDCVCYCWKGHFFTGDAIFANGRIGWSHARWLTNYSDIAESMKRLMSVRVPADRFYAAHGPDYPYDIRKVPESIYKNALELCKRESDPCNHTPEVERRKPDDPTRTLQFPM